MSLLGCVSHLCDCQWSLVVVERDLGRDICDLRGEKGSSLGGCPSIEVR